MGVLCSESVCWEIAEEGLVGGSRGAEVGDRAGYLACHFEEDLGDGIDVVHSRSSAPGSDRDDSRLLHHDRNRSANAAQVAALFVPSHQPSG